MDATDSEVAIGAPGSPAGPCAIALFGAGGDLTKRKLIPSIYNLARGKLLPEQFAIVGVSIEPFSTEEFRQRMTEDIKQFAEEGVDMPSWEWFVKRLYYISGDFKDPQLYSKLCETLKTVDKEQGTQGNVLFYLATSPE
ncbi:MAG: hypothetical protein WAJ86_16820, partial [Candidatus Acidiferrales bacterium]